MPTPEIDPFRVCKLPLGSYQSATFMAVDSNSGLEEQYTPPIYTVEFEAAIRTPFVIERCMTLLDKRAMDKLVTALTAAAHPTKDNVGTLSVLMRSEQYGSFRQ